MNAKTNTSSSVRPDRAVFIALALAAFLLFFRLGDRPLRNPDEGRYAEIAREMSVSGDWVKPTVFGIGYLRKPPLLYWLNAASFRAFGENEWAARAVPAVFGWFTVLLVYGFTARFFDRSRALYASLILATNLWFVQASRYLVIDPVFSFFVTASVLSFYAAVKCEKDRVLPFAFFASLGLAFLAKGPSALVLVAAPAGVFLFQKKKVFLSAPWWGGRALFFAIVLPWFFLMARRVPGFFDFFFMHEHVRRYTASAFEHQEPWYYYFVMFPLLLLPWSFYPRTWFGDRSNELRRYLWLVIGVVVLFFSVSRSKLPTYILPAFPLIAILAADSWKRWTEEKTPAPLTDLAPALVVCAAGLGLIIGAPAFLHSHAERYPEALQGTLQLLGGVLTAGGVLAARSLKHGRRERFFFSFVLLMAAVSLCVPRLMEVMNPVYSTKAFAEKLKAHPREEEVFVYDHPGPFYDFPFYLGRPVKLVGMEGELEHFRQDENAPLFSVTRDAFFSRVRDGRPLAAMMRRSDFNDLDPALRGKLEILDQDRRKVLVRT